MMMMMMMVGAIFIEYWNETHTHNHKNKQPIMEKKSTYVSLSLLCFEMKSVDEWK